MGKLSQFFILCMFFCVGAFASEMKRYEIKSGEVLYDISGNGVMMKMPTTISGKSRVIFKEYGAVELTQEKITQTLMGQADITNEITKFDKGIVYSVDEEEKVIFKQKVPMDSDDYLYLGKGESYLESIGGNKLGTQTILGYKCDIWDLSGVRMCLYKSFPLKIESEMMGVIHVQTAKSIKFDISLSDKEFALPSYPIQSMEDVMQENLKQMENLPPEQQKMMHEMMRNMPGMSNK